MHTLNHKCVASAHILKYSDEDIAFAENLSFTRRKLNTQRVSDAFRKQRVAGPCKNCKVATG